GAGQADRAQRRAAVRERADRRRERQSGDADVVAEGRAREGDAAPALARRDQSARLAGEVDARLRPEAERVERVVVRVLPEGAADLDHPDVRADLQDVGDVEPAPAVALAVA